MNANDMIISLKSTPHIDISGKRYDTNCAISLAELIREENITIESFISRANPFKDSGAIALLNVLSNCSQLLILDMRCCSLGCISAKVFASLLATNESLEELNLSMNSIKDAGTKSIACSLRMNKSLKIIDMSFNLIKNESASIIAKSLKTNKGLINVKLKENLFGKEAAKHIAKAVRLNRKLKDVTILNNNVRFSLII